VVRQDPRQGLAQRTAQLGHERGAEAGYAPPVPHSPHVHVTAGRVLVAAAVTALAAAIELSASWASGSLFLTADAVHLVAHLGIFIVLLLPSRGPHEAREDIVTCTVLVLVVAIAAGIGVHSATDLFSETPPRPAAMLFSLFGLGANLATAWLFRDPAQERWSFRAALAHELSDASLTIAGLLGAGAIALFHFRWVDPGLSLAIALWLAVWAGRLLLRRVRIGRSAWEHPEGHAGHSHRPAVE
jgi:cobalt-zinc-cadmium efflux system protein